jgi:hypothetical protein
MKANEILNRQPLKRLDLSLRLLASPDGSKPFVLIEGGPDALSLLASLLMAVAQDKTENVLSFAPDDDGRRCFDPKSEFGVYIHCARRHTRSGRQVGKGRSRRSVFIKAIYEKT